MKNGIQISLSDDGAYTVTQLNKRPGDAEYTSLGVSIFVDTGGPKTDQNLLHAIADGLAGRITQTKRLKG
jgi:hypothetical protein